MSQRQPTANAKVLTLDKLASTSGNSSRRDMASAQHHTPPPVPAAPPSVPPAFAFAPIPTPALATVKEEEPDIPKTARGARPSSSLHSGFMRSSKKKKKKRSRREVEYEEERESARARQATVDDW